MKAKFYLKRTDLFNGCLKYTTHTMSHWTRRISAVIWQSVFHVQIFREMKLALNDGHSMLYSENTTTIMNSGRNLQGFHGRVLHLNSSVRLWSPRDVFVSEDLLQSAVVPISVRSARTWAAAAALCSHSASAAYAPTFESPTHWHIQRTASTLYHYNVSQFMLSK